MSGHGNFIIYPRAALSIAWWCLVAFVTRRRLIIRDVDILDRQPEV